MFPTFRSWCQNARAHSWWWGQAGGAAITWAASLTAAAFKFQYRKTKTEKNERTKTEMTPSGCWKSQKILKQKEQVAPSQLAGRKRGSQVTWRLKASSVEMTSSGRLFKPLQTLTPPPRTPTPPLLSGRVQAWRPPADGSLWGSNLTTVSHPLEQHHHQGVRLATINQSPIKIHTHTRWVESRADEEAVTLHSEVNNVLLRFFFFVCFLPLVTPQNAQN